MIRAARPADTDEIVATWLAASEESHRFVDPDFWRSRADAMRDIYLPAAETYVAIVSDRVVGFASLVGDELAALFVSPESQGGGIGTALLDHVKSIRSQLTLAVYVENDRARSFYVRNGFRHVNDRIDPETGRPESVMVWEHAIG